MPLVNDVSVILIVQIVGEVIGGARRTEHCHETWVVVALLHGDNTMHNKHQTQCNECHYQSGLLSGKGTTNSIVVMRQIKEKHAN